MPVTTVVVNALFCDQGMGTLFRIYNKEELTNLALMDLGSKSKLKKGAGRAVSFVIQALKKMKKPAIDLVVISHGDDDHWNLLEFLQQNIELDPELKGTTVTKMDYGGGAWSKKSIGKVGDFATALKGTAEPLPVGESDYIDPGKPPAFYFDIGPVKFHLLVSTVGIPGGSKSVQRNGGSAVVAVHFGGNTAIIPGDATADTLQWLNYYVFKPWEALTPPKNPIQKCQVLAVPHHGASYTIADKYVAKKRKLDPDAPLSIPDAFAKYVSALNIVASAGALSQYSHPAKSVMLQLSKAVTDEAPAHNWVWYDDSIAFGKKEATGWTTVTGERQGIYTTITSLLTKPPTVDEPEFTMTAEGEVFFTFRRVEAETIPPYERFDRYAATPHER